MYLWPTTADMLGTLPPDEQAELIAGAAGWLGFSPQQWDLITAAVKARPVRPKETPPCGPGDAWG